jgi:hypothetical protein
MHRVANVGPAGEPAMTAPQLATIKSRLENVIALARLLERVEATVMRIAPEQYQALIKQLTVALSQELPDDALQAVLGAHPAAAEVYENMHYAQSGLSRSSLDRSIGSELLASQLIARVSKRAS